MGDALPEDWSYAEPCSAAGAAALLGGERPATFQLDVGASGFCGYEVMDARGPVPYSEAADADLSLMSFLDYREGAFWKYPKRVTGADYRETFHCLTFHTTFCGMVKGAHRTFQTRSGRKWLSLHPLTAERLRMKGLWTQLSLVISVMQSLPSRGFSRNSRILFALDVSF